MHKQKKSQDCIHLVFVGIRFQVDLSILSGMPVGCSVEEHKQQKYHAQKSLHICKPK